MHLAFQYQPVRKWTLTLSLVFFLTGFVFSQQAWTIYNSSNSPLPENSVRCIAVAPNGTKWIGTDFGLASFDGSVWTVYYTSNSGLPDNAIRSLAIDSAGVIWIGTFTGGLSRFDGNTWTTYNVANSDIPDDYVRSLVIDTLGNKWVGTIGGLAYFDNVSWEVYTTATINMGSNNISALLLDPSDNSLTVGTVNGGINFVDNGNWTHLTNGNSNLPDNTILGLTRDTAGVLWLGTPASGISAYIGGFLFLTFNTSSSSIQSNSIRAIITNNANDNLWMASVDSGVIRKAGSVYTSFTTFNSPMPDNYAQSLAYDQDGILWIGTQTGGLVRLDESLLTSAQVLPDEQTFRLYPVPARDFITVEGVGSKLSVMEIFDSMGRMVFRKENVEGEQTSIDLSDLRKGSYFIRIVSESGAILNRKILLQ